MIRIVNLNDYTLKEGEVLIKVDRNSALGNPFRMSYENQRDTVCDLYETYFDNKVNNPADNENFMVELRRIYSTAKRQDVALGCWCFPKKCHAITIKKFIDRFLEAKGGETYKSFAGIGSRECPDWALSVMRHISRVMSSKGYILRSGGAEGADITFERNYQGQKEIYLPWKNFNGNPSNLIVKSGKAYEIARKYHPYFDNLKEGAKKLHSRNSHQILGANLDTPSNAVFCYTKEGKGSGGTGQALRIAKDYDIPVFDIGLYTEDTVMEALKFFIMEHSL